MVGLEKYLCFAKNIFDIGTGPNGSCWWTSINSLNHITGIDLYFFPKKIPKNVSIFKYDASFLYRLKSGEILPEYINFPFKKFRQRQIDWQHQFDLVVANHVFEHVADFPNLVKGIDKIIQPDGIVYATFPESTNFTDIFYHLIHPEGGGHLQKLRRQKVINTFKKYNFKLLSCCPIPDDWLWLETQYDYKFRQVKFISQSEISFLANTFRKELTLKKGYFYGWEMVFQKQS